LTDADAVGAAVREIVEDAARKAIAARGSFALAIPGGSILKMLVGSGRMTAPNESKAPDESPWTCHTTLAYVNHKCVSMEDAALATHAKARQLFLEEWEGCHTIVLQGVLQGTADGPAEAQAYQAQLAALPVDVLPRSPETGLPIFDLALIGVGDDGHVGSLYPHRDQVLSKESWVASQLGEAYQNKLPVE
jgi:6-phosphogluconolactonase